MTTKQDEWKSLIDAVGKMIDARHKTLQTNLKGYIEFVVTTSEQRIRKDMATKDDIKDMATKDDIKRLEAKIDKKYQDADERFTIIEEELHITRAGKN